MFNEVITLVKQEKSVDEYGDITVVETERQVFAKLASISQSEFYQAQAVGFKPELKFIIADYLDYKNEPLVKYQGYADDDIETYSVIRTYRNGNALEIIVKRGVDNVSA